MRLGLVPLIVALTVANLGAACGDNGDDEVSDDALIYTAAIRCLIDEARPGERPLEATAYVDTPDVEVDLEDQVAVIQQLEDVAPVRFIDERKEAVVDDRPHQPVREEGILITLGPIERRDRKAAELDAERYERSDEEQTHRLVLAPRRGTWRVRQPGCGPP